MVVEAASEDEVEGEEGSEGGGTDLEDA